MVEFDKDGAIRAKKYLINYVVEGDERRPVIVITNNKYTFSINHKIQKAWTQKEDTLLQSKRQGQKIINSNFLLFWPTQPNFFIFSKKERSY